MNGHRTLQAFTLMILGAIVLAGLLIILKKELKPDQPVVVVMDRSGAKERNFEENADGDDGEGPAGAGNAGGRSTGAAVRSGVKTGESGRVDALRDPRPQNEGLVEEVGREEVDASAAAAPAGAAPGGAPVVNILQSGVLASAAGAANTGGAAEQSRALRTPGPNGIVEGDSVVNNLERVLGGGISDFGSGGGPTPTPQSTAQATPTPDGATPTAEPTASATADPNATPSPSPTASPEATPSPTGEVTPTATPEPTTPSPTASASPSATPPPTATPEPSETEEPEPTETPEETPEETPLPTQSPSPSPSESPTPTPHPGFASIYVNPALVQAQVGQPFEVNLYVESREKAVGGYRAILLWNPLQLRLNQVYEGTDSYLGYPFDLQINNSTGVCRMSSFQGTSLNQPVGRLHVGVLEFQPLEGGTGAVEIIGPGVSNTDAKEMVIERSDGFQAIIAAPTPVPQ